MRSMALPLYASHGFAMTLRMAPLTTSLPWQALSHEVAQANLGRDRKSNAA